MSTPTVHPAAPRVTGVAIARSDAALIEVVSIAVSVGVGHLVAGLVSPVSSPFQAVADTVVRWAPAWLTDVGKMLDFPAIGLPKGVADKVLLLVGVGVALVVTGVLAGLVAHRSRTAGRRVIIVLGLVGTAAVVLSPVFEPIDLVAPGAAMLVGLSVYFRLYNQAEWLARDGGPRATGIGRGLEPSGPQPFGLEPAGPEPAGPEPFGSEPPVAGGGGPAGTAPGVSGPVAAPPARGTELTRRRLLAHAAVGGLGAVGAGVVGQRLGAGVGADSSGQASIAPRLRPALPAAAVPGGADFAAAGTPSFITANRDFYRIDTALRIPAISVADYRLRVHGMVERELELSYDDLLRRPLEERVVTLVCVSNVVNGDLISTAAFTGVPLRDVLLEAGVRPGADQILGTSHDGWTCGTPTDVVLEPDRGALLAVAMNGEPLPREHGYPVRMVVPGLYGFVSATKWLTDLELTTWEGRRAYWLDRGWAQQAPVKTQSRIDRPRGLDTVPAGRFTAAGIAWAQHRGISRVEVRLDGGPWLPALLSAEYSRDTWRMWRIELEVAPGEHVIESRATDGAGSVQVEARAEPAPDGATGWPRIAFTAR